MAQVPPGFPRLVHRDVPGAVCLARKSTGVWENGSSDVHGRIYNWVCAFDYVFLRSAVTAPQAGR